MFFFVFVFCFWLFDSVLLVSSGVLYIVGGGVFVWLCRMVFLLSCVHVLILDVGCFFVLFYVKV